MFLGESTYNGSKYPSREPNKFAEIWYKIRQLDNKINCLSNIIDYSNGALSGSAGSSFLGIDYSTGNIYYRDSSGNWALAASGGGTNFWTKTGDDITNNNTGAVNINTLTANIGDVAGNGNNTGIFINDSTKATYIASDNFIISPTTGSYSNNPLILTNNSGLIVIGDINNQVNSTSIFLNDSTQEVQINTLGFIIGSSLYSSGLLSIEGDSSGIIALGDSGVDVNGTSIVINDSTNSIRFNNSYTFPKIHGTFGQTLIDDGSGNLLWDTAGTVTNVSSSSGDITITSSSTTPILTLENINGIPISYYDITSSIQTQLNSKQATLVSGTSIKTINGTSLLGSGDYSPNLTGDITSTGLITTYNNIVPSTKGGAGNITGILKANGSGTITAAISGTDYAAPLFGTGLISQSGGTTSYNTTSASIAAILTDETGTGSMVFNTTPTLIGPIFAAGTTTVAPINLTSGVDKTTPAAGNLEFNGTRLAFSPSTTRKRVTLTNDVAPSNGQIPIGNTTDYTVANITGSNGVIVTNGAGTIALAGDLTSSSPYVLRSGTQPLTGNWNAGPFSIASIQTAATSNSIIDGLILSNTTVATTGNQQYSPAIHFAGQGQQTTIPASQAVDIKNYLVPVQGATIPTAILKWDLSTNSQAYKTVLSLTTSLDTSDNIASANLDIIMAANKATRMGGVNNSGFFAGWMTNGNGVIPFGTFAGNYISQWTNNSITVATATGNSGRVQFGSTTATGASAGDIPSAQVSVVSTTTGTIMNPLMTSTQRTAIATPATGLHVYQTDSLEGTYINTSYGWVQTPNSLTASGTLTFGSTGAGAKSDQTVTLTGAIIGDVVCIGVPTVPANGVFFGWVSAANTVTIRYINNDTLTSYTPTVGTYTVKILR